MSSSSSSPPQNQNRNIRRSSILPNLPPQSRDPQNWASQVGLSDDGNDEGTLPVATLSQTSDDYETNDSPTQRLNSPRTLHLGKDGKDRSGGFLLRGAGTAFGHRGIQSREIQLPKDANSRNNQTRMSNGEDVTQDDSYKEPGMSIKGRKGKGKGKGKSKEIVGRSPLGIEVMRLEDIADSRYGQEVTGSNANEQSYLIGQQSTRTGSAPIFGTDEAQIVGLALNLSENRRRQFSTGFISPTMHPNGSNMIPSAAVRAPLPSGPLRNLRVRPRNPTYHAELASPSDFSARRSSAGFTRLSPRTQDRSSSDSASQFSSLQSRGASVEENNIYPSESTMQRVEKAKIAFELAYEYRRALQYLPKLPISQDHRPLKVRSTARQYSESSSTLGRVYNPLQYVRNRKVRGREQDLLNAEAEGWKDIQAVRLWVDKVAEDASISATSENPHDPSLPVFPPQSHSTPPMLQLASVSPTSRATSSLARELRPRSDWVTTPWDMLADTYWLEQAGNETLIEDRKGRRIFGTHRPKARTYSRPGKYIEPESSRRSMSLPRSTTAITRKPDTVAYDKPLSDRGRPRHKRLYSFTSGHDKDSSQDRRGGWRRLIRSDSSSSSDGSGTAIGQKRPKAQSRPTTRREQHEKLILEKQIRRLLAREAEFERKEASDAVESENLDGVLEGSPESVESGQAVKDLDMYGPMADSLEQHTGKQAESCTDCSGKDHVIQDEDGQQPFPMENRRSPSSSRKRGSITINVSPPRSHSRKRLSQLSSSALEVEQDHEMARGNNGTQGSFNTLISKLTDDTHSIGAILKQSPKAVSSLGQLSPQSAESFNRNKRSIGSVRHSRSTESKDFETKLRGLLKGTKIAHIVGNPISKVGDLIWNKDDADEDVFQSPMANTPENSDLDTVLSSKTSRSTRRDSYTVSSKGSYGRPELPIFRSPFMPGTSERRDVKPAASGSKLVSRADRNSGLDSKSGVDRPLLDMKSILSKQTESTIMDVGTFQEDEKRPGSSSSTDIGRIPRRRSTGRRGAIANDLFDPPKRQETFFETAIEPDPALDTIWPKHDPFSFITISKRKLSPLLTVVGERDVQDLKVLSESSLVVSSEIVRQVSEIMTFSSESEDTMLVSLQGGRSLNARAQSKLLEIQMVTNNIKAMNQDLNHETADFATRIMPRVMEQLQSIERRVAVELTPIVRASGDDADRLSAELATTRTLELQRLNDEIDLFTRRKRRRFRWLRRSVYLALEWTLIGLMWWAWFVVVMVRIVRTGIEGFFALIRWLLWL